VGSEPKDVESAAWRNSVTAAGERNVVRALEALRVGDLRRARQSLLDALRALEEVR
jgi:Tfp pilus assembly protein PilF